MSVRFCEKFSTKFLFFFFQKKQGRSGKSDIVCRHRGSVIQIPKTLPAKTLGKCVGKKPWERLILGGVVPRLDYTLLLHECVTRRSPLSFPGLGLAVGLTPTL